MFKLIGGNDELAAHINQYIKDGWLILFELNSLEMLKDIEKTVYTPGTDKNIDFELTGQIGPLGTVTIGFCKKNDLLHDYFKYISPDEININKYAICFSVTYSDKELILTGFPLCERVDYTEAVRYILKNLTMEVVE